MAEPKINRRCLIDIHLYHLSTQRNRLRASECCVNALTADSNGATQESHSYYAGGLPWSYIFLTPTDTHSYNDKEFDHIHGLDWYDYGARRYDPAFCQFTQIDPLAEKYYHLNPYTYCAGNPVRYVDPDGMTIDLSLMSEEERKRYLKQIEFMSDNSPLFNSLYQSLQNSKDLYMVQYGEINREGLFEMNDKGGGAITFSTKIQKIKAPVLSEELFHAYQYDNRYGYDSGEFNREFEAKAFTYTVAAEVGGITIYDDTNLFLQNIFLGTYGNSKFAITPNIVNSTEFLTEYKKQANIFAHYNKKHGIGNRNYHRTTMVNPFALQKIINETYRK